MTDASPLRPADSAEVADALAYALRYDEGGRSMLITIDAGAGAIAIFHGSMRWDDAPGVLLDAANDRRITENICRALEWRGYSVDLNVLFS